MKCLIIETYPHQRRYSQALAKVIAERLNWQVEAENYYDLFIEPGCRPFALRNQRISPKSWRLAFIQSAKNLYRVAARRCLRILWRQQCLASLWKSCLRTRFPVCQYIISYYKLVRYFDSVDGEEAKLAMALLARRIRIKILTLDSACSAIYQLLFSINCLPEIQSQPAAKVRRVFGYIIALPHGLIHNALIVLLSAALYLSILIFRQLRLVRSAISLLLFLPFRSQSTIWREFQIWGECLAELKRTLKILSASTSCLVNCDLIITYELNPIPYLVGLNVASRQAKIPVLLIPDFLPNPAEQAFSLQYLSAHTLSGWIEGVVKRVSKSWLFSFNGKTLIRVPLNQLMAGIFLYRHCKMPWIVNSGFVSRILLPSEKEKDYYLKTEFNPATLEVIGSSIDDQLFSSLNDDAAKRKVLLEYGLDPARPLIVCALPPSQYTDDLQDLVLNKYEFPTYSELLSAWLSALANQASAFNVLLCLHPRTSIDELRQYSAYGIPVCSQSIEIVLPFADLYVASISTTIRMALACGIPVINYDCYRYDYADFQSATAVEHVNTLPDFKEALTRLSQPSLLKAARSTAEEEANLWGCVDGKFATRLAVILESTALTRKDACHYRHTHSHLKSGYL